MVGRIIGHYRILEKLGGGGKSTNRGLTTEDTENTEEEQEDEEDSVTSVRSVVKGFSLIYDVVRRFAQPLGIHLENWEGRIIETKKGIVRLIPVVERAEQLFGEAGTDAAALAIERSGGREPQYTLFPQGERTEGRHGGLPLQRRTRGRSRSAARNLSRHRREGGMPDAGLKPAATSVAAQQFRGAG